MGIGNNRTFLVIELLFGFLSLYAFINLPASESHNAIWMGLSLVRLIIITLYIIITLSLLVLLMFTFTNTQKYEAEWKRAVLFLYEHDLFESTVYSLSFLFCIILLSLELFIHHAILPGARYYQFLYERFRPISFWAAAFSGHLFFFNRKHFWKKKLPQKTRSRFIDKYELICLLFFIISWIAMLILWVLYIRFGNGFVNFFYMNRILLSVSLILLLMPIWLTHASNRK